MTPFEKARRAALAATTDEDRIAAVVAVRQGYRAQERRANRTVPEATPTKEPKSP